MAELLYYMEKLRGLMKKYQHIVQRYHVQYLAQFDALVLNDTIQVAVHANVCARVSLSSWCSMMWKEGNSVTGVHRQDYVSKLPFRFCRTCMCVRKRSRC